MTSPSFNYFYRVELTVIRLGDQLQSGTQTVRTKISKTYNFVSKSLRDAITPSDRETMLPILESVGEVSLNAGEFLPSTSFSSISILNHRGSFGADRRFSDILERFTVINQDINFYVGESDNFTDVPTSWQQIASGQVQSWSTSLGGQEPTLSFQIAPYKASDKVMNLEVSRDIGGMENAPDSTLGVALPIVFNKIHSNQTTPLSSYPQVNAVRISTDGAETAKYALCTLMHRSTTARIVANYYAKKSWETDADLWATISFTRDVDSYLTTTGSTRALNTYVAEAYRIPEHAAGSNATGFVVQGVLFSAVGGSSNPARVSGASIAVSILRVDRDTYAVIDTVATGRAQLNNYDASNNVSGQNFEISISFDQPVVLELMSNRAYDFYIAYEVTGWAAGDMSFRLHPTASRSMVKIAGGNTGDWSIISPAPSTVIAHKLQIVTATAVSYENTYSKDGFTYASLTLSQPAPDTGQSNPPLDSLSIVGLVEGFYKFSFDTGTTSGNSGDYYLGSLSGDSYFFPLREGITITFTPHVNNAANALLSSDFTGRLYVYLNGAPITANQMIAGVPVTGVVGTQPPSSNLSYFHIIPDASLRVLDAPTALKILSYEWNGEKWNSVDAVDTTTLTATHYTPLFTSNSGNHRARYLTGILEGKVSYSQVISEIARASAAKIGIFSSKKLFVYPWGVTATPTFNIPQADIIPLSWETRDSSTVMNRTSITFDRVYAIEEGMDIEGGYAYSIDFSNPSYIPVQKITEESRALYGTQNIVENKFSVFGYSDYYANVGMPGYLTGGPSNSQPVESGRVVFSVDFLAEYYMTRFAFPAVYCSFVVPWHRYKNIKMFDVINFAHSEFPAFYGTDPNARPGVVISGSNTTPVVNAGYGYEFTRAQTYRGLIEGISYIMAMEHAPAIRLTVLVLLNREYDPT